MKNNMEHCHIVENDFWLSILPFGYLKWDFLLSKVTFLPYFFLPSHNFCPPSAKINIVKPSIFRKV